MKDKLVVKRNEVINASYRLSVVEQRILLIAISKIPKQVEISDDKLYTVSVEDLKALGVHEKTAYRDLKDAVNRLYERSINFTTGSGVDETVTKIRWVQEIRYTDGARVVALRFSKPLLPYITNVKDNFTQYFLSEVALMKSAYSIRMYELCKQYLSIGKRKVAIEDLRTILDLSTKYSTTGNLMLRVIEPAVKEINELTKIVITAEPQRTGRKYTHILFTIKQKKEDINEVYRNKDTAVDKEKKQTWRNKGLSDSQIIRLQAKYRSEKFFNDNLVIIENMGFKTQGKSTKEVFDNLQFMLKDPSKLSQLKNIQECLDM